MVVFANGKLEPRGFDGSLLGRTRELRDVLAAAARTQSPSVESTHFLIALADIPNGATASWLARQGLTADQWKSGLSACAIQDPDSLPPTQLEKDSFHESALSMLASSEKHATEFHQPRVTEAVLLLSALENLTPDAIELFDATGIDVDNWCSQIVDSLKVVVPPKLFADNEAGPIRLEAFTSSGRTVLSLMKDEAESLGYGTLDSRHLLQALLIFEAGATRYGLHLQTVPPKRLREAVTLSLRSRSRSTRSEVPLDRGHLQALLRRALVLAGEFAARKGCEAIAEQHLLWGFLQTESAARRILEDQEVDVARLIRTAETHAAEEKEGPEECSIASIDVVRDRLKERLVGQDDAIGRILPYIQRMRFGFSLPGRPEGVFLFCGPSGSGKTEMAKELARAVYGSEENMLFLEMGQFNARESMNIFVGAPPGYVGYGEGKLTNGLRDKPNAVVLFDEVEKAHPLVLDALLRFLDEGKIGDPAGPERDGTGTIVVLTSNLGAKELAALWQQIESNPNWRPIVRRKLRGLFEASNFRVEFLNRVDELILFRTLSAGDYAEIARRFLKDLLTKLRTDCQIDVQVDGVYEEIGSYCRQINEGARTAHRITLAMVITPVIDFVLRNNVARPVTVKVTAECATDAKDAEPIGRVSLV